MTFDPTPRIPQDYICIKNLYIMGEKFEEGKIYKIEYIGKMIYNYRKYRGSFPDSRFDEHFSTLQEFRQKQIDDILLEGNLIK